MNARSFTLIELLLGLLIFAVVSCGLYGVFYGALRFDQRARGWHTLSRDSRLALDMLARDLENALPYPQIVDGEVIAFEGRSSWIAFYVPEVTGLRRVEYYAGDLLFKHKVRMRHLSSVRETFDADGKAVQPAQYLLRRSQALPDFWQRKKDAAELMGIVGGLAPGGVTFRFGRKSESGNVTFEDKWKSDRLPEVVRVQCVFNDPQGHSEGHAVVLDIFPIIKILNQAGA